MGDVVIVKTAEGRLEGHGEKAQRAYGRWKATVAAMEVGETLRFTWKVPRSPKFHRLFFAMLGNLDSMQEQFADEHQLRAWLIVGAGEHYCDFVPGPTGRMVALPKSIAWENMEDDEFRDLVVAVWRFIRTEHAKFFLWPLASPASRDEGVERLLAGWEE